MYDTKYFGKEPKKVGEQHSKKFAPGSASPEYQQVGSKTSYPDKSTDSARSTHKSTHKYRSPWLNGGGSKQVSASYSNKTHAGFKSEGAKNTLMSPMSGKPKAK